MEHLLTTEALVGFLTLTVLEIVLGIDNVIFIAILAGKLPPEQAGKARSIGLALTMITRIILLLGISWVMKLTTPLFAIAGHSFTGKHLILLVGGLFLIGKSAHEIYDKLEVQHEDKLVAGKAAFGLTIFQIVLLDIVFSLDSVITAVGMLPPDKIPIMIAAVIVAVIVMLLFAGPISNFVNRHPSMKILALSFLLLIGVMLVAEGFDQHINKGYIYSAMAFAVFVEILNMRFRKKQKPVTLHHKYEEQAKAE